MTHYANQNWGEMFSSSCKTVKTWNVAVLQFMLNPSIWYSLPFINPMLYCIWLWRARPVYLGGRGGEKGVCWPLWVVNPSALSSAFWFSIWFRGYVYHFAVLHLWKLEADDVVITKFQCSTQHIANGLFISLYQAPFVSFLPIVVQWFSFPCDGFLVADS